MLEVLLLIGFSGLLGGSVLVLVRKGLTSRRFNVNPGLPAPNPPRLVPVATMRAIEAAPSVRPSVSPEIKAEMDRTPEWWSKEFHKALRASGAEPSETTEGYSILEKSLSGNSTVELQVPGHSIYSECPCKECSTHEA